MTTTRSCTPENSARYNGVVAEEPDADNNQSNARGHGSAREPTADLQVHVVDGQEGEQLLHQQAKVFTEILEWQARQQSSETAEDT